MFGFDSHDLGFAVPADMPVLPGYSSIEPMLFPPKDLLRRSHDMLVLAWAKC
jgi:hypothetical protein